MHELSLMKSLIDTIEIMAAQNKAKQVVSLTVKLGVLSNMSPQHFKEHFYELAVGSIAEHATLRFELDQDFLSPNAQDILIDSIEVVS